MGGGGFTSEPQNPLLDEYVLTLAAAPRPRICFLPTASGDPDRHLADFYAAFGERQCEPTHVSLFRLGRAPGRDETTRASVSSTKCSAAPSSEA